MVLLPLTSLYPGWLISYPFFSITSFCNIMISAPQTIPSSMAIIAASYPLPQLCIMHFTILSGGFLGSLCWSLIQLSPVSKQLGPSAPQLVALFPECSSLLTWWRSHLPRYDWGSSVPPSLDFGVLLPSPSRFTFPLLLSESPPAS